MTLSKSTVDASTTPIIDVGDRIYHDQHALYRELRERGPIHKLRVEGGEFWVAVEYDAARQVLSDPALSKDTSSPQAKLTFAANHAEYWDQPVFDGCMLLADPPKHTRLRRLVTKAFANGTIAKLEQHITAVTNSLLDDMAAFESTDLIGSFAFPLPMAVISELLGVPNEDRDSFRDWSATILDTAAPMEVKTAAGEAFTAYLHGLIERRTVEPGEDLVSDLIAASEDGDRLDSQELMGMIVLLLMSGHETTVNLIANSVLELLRTRIPFEQLLSDPAEIQALLEEVLRFQGPVDLSTVRFTTEPITVSGVEIEANQLVFASLLAAGRDPKVISDPDTFNPQRTDGQHVAFGHGIHYCIGAQLARLEARIALSRLLTRFPDLALGTDVSELRWRTSAVIHGLTELPVRLGQAV